jgi:aldose 1-epimerase
LVHPQILPGAGHRYGSGSNLLTVYETLRETHPSFPEHEVVRLVSPAGVIASFIPGAGMVGHSLTLDGIELLGMREGLEAYLERGKTFGISLRAPWANRLGKLAYAVVHEGGGVHRVDVDPEAPGVRLDSNGHPIHGLLSGSPDWVVQEVGTTIDSAFIRATLDFHSSRPDFSAFPFAHTIEITATLRSTVLTIVTKITPTGDDDVPVVFGWNPFFNIPGVDRKDWNVYLPFTDHLPLDETKIPTGQHEQLPAIVGPYGDRSLDALYGGVADGTTGMISANGIRIGVRFDNNYHWAILWGRSGETAIGIEPMTAASDPFSGRDPMKIVPVGSSFAATFSVKVDRVS